MRVLVTGGSGYVGGAVVRALVGHGHKVTGLTRSPAAQKTLAALNAHARPGDLAQPASLRRAADGHAVLIHAASFPSPEVDRDAIFALIDAAVASGEPRVVIYTSGVWTLGEGGGHEDTPADHPARKSQHRPALERDVLAAATADVATAVIRPGMVYGGTEGIAHLLCDVIGDGAPTYIGEGRNRWTPVHRDDVGELYRLVAEKRARGIYHAAEPEAVEQRELARLLHEAGARPPQSLPHAQAMDKLGLLGEALAIDSVLVARRAWDLGWRPQSRFTVTVSQTWKEFRREAP